MADEKPPSGSPMQDIFLFLGFLAVLVTAWYATGGPSRADLRGIFLAPPAPLGSGDAYGPNVGSTTIDGSYYMESSTTNPVQEPPAPQQYQQ